MASPTAGIELLLATTMRVLRNATRLEEIIEAWPSLREKSLCSPPTLTEQERRIYFDLPDEEMELSNLRAVTSRSREELIEKALSSREQLTEKELIVLMDRFWTPISPNENQLLLVSMSNTSDENQAEFYRIRGLPHTLNEEAAFNIAGLEYSGRKSRVRAKKVQYAADVALLDAPEWIRLLYREGKRRWGFVCLWDPGFREMDPELFDDLRETLETVLQVARRYNGSKDLVDTRWELLHFYAPDGAIVPPKEGGGVGEDIHDGILLRGAFQDILADAQKYQNAGHMPFWEDEMDSNVSEGESIAESGILTNTFLVIDSTCIRSVVPYPDELDLAHANYDDMRILAYEAEFPVPDREYVDGYQGFSWIRLDQLVYNFYELRLTRPDEVGMDEIWKAAQGSYERAFVSLLPEEASSRTHSGSMQGFTQESVLGRRWYPLMEKRRAEEMARPGYVLTENDKFRLEAAKGFGKAPSFKIMQLYNVGREYSSSSGAIIAVVLYPEAHLVFQNCISCSPKILVIPSHFISSHVTSSQLLSIIKPYNNTKDEYLPASLFAPSYF
ncbi:hypothetical protein VTL71DRAFT_10063 [Oculimacula yallundae]|uniref:Uncharacterized protein n=1 Tax=Oculimacula yallundae TaxID=86028 RepID=A0ABR4BQ84_9HELO